MCRKPVMIVIHTHLRIIVPALRICTARMRNSCQRQQHAQQHAYDHSNVLTFMLHSNILSQFIFIFNPRERAKEVNPLKRPITIQDVPEDIRQQIILDYLDTQNTSSTVMALQSAQKMLENILINAEVSSPGAIVEVVEALKKVTDHLTLEQIRHQ